MGRNPSVNWLEIEREYVYAEPKTTFTELADKHKVARSALAGKAATGEWFQKRAEFRAKLGEKTLDALTDKWAAMESATREKMMETATTVLDTFMVALKAGEVKISPRDAALWIDVIRTQFADVRNSARGEVIDGNAEDMDPEEARRAMAEIQRMLGDGVTDADPAT